MYDYAYSAKPRSANPPKLEVRIATIHFKIAAVMDSDVDDMLVLDILLVCIWACPSCLI